MQTEGAGARKGKGIGGAFKNLNGDVCRFVFIEIATQTRRRRWRWRWSRCRRCLYLSTNDDNIYEHIYVHIFRSQILRNDERQRWWCCPDDHSLLTPLDDFVAVFAFRLWLPFPYCNIVLSFPPFPPSDPFALSPAPTIAIIAQV